MDVKYVIRLRACMIKVPKTSKIGIRLQLLKLAVMKIYIQILSFTNYG